MIFLKVYYDTTLHFWIVFCLSKNKECSWNPYSFSLHQLECSFSSESIKLDKSLARLGIRHTHPYNMTGMLISPKWRLVEPPPPSMKPVLFYGSKHMSLSTSSGVVSNLFMQDHTSLQWASSSYLFDILFKLVWLGRKKRPLGFHISVYSVLW